jgi:hypothetical protein
LNFFEKSEVCTTKSFCLKTCTETIERIDPRNKDQKLIFISIKIAANPQICPFQLQSWHNNEKQGGYNSVNQVQLVRKTVYVFVRIAYAASTPKVCNAPFFVAHGTWK